MNLIARFAAVALLLTGAAATAQTTPFKPGLPVSDTNPQPVKIQAAGDAPTGTSYTMRDNASGAGTGTAVTNIKGGGYVFNIAGVFSGTTATLKVTDAAGSYQTVATCTIACNIGVNIGQGSSARVDLTGGAPTGIFAKLQGFGGPVGTTIGGIQGSAKLMTSTIAAPGANSGGLTLSPRGDFNYSLTGTFTARCGPQRSFDNGVTWLPLTAFGNDILFTGPVSELFTEPEAGVLWRTFCVSWTSGTVTERISQ